jgi:hypothetical protein
MNCTFPDPVHTAEDGRRVDLGEIADDGGTRKGPRGGDADVAPRV